MVASHVPSVYELFERACRRPAGTPAGQSGLRQFDADGNSVVFWVSSQGGRITAAQYQSSSCVTLIALCEHLSHLMPGLTFAEAASITPFDLLRLHPEIPAERRDRAALAIAAARSASSLEGDGA